MLDAPFTRNGEVMVPQGTGHRPETSASGRVPRVAVVCDLLEELWPSMDLVGDMLLDSVTHGHSDRFSVTRIRPRMRRRFSREFRPGDPATPRPGGRWFNIDRALNRFWDYPRHLHRTARGFDLYHVVDHTYSHLVHALPRERTIVTCHDLYTFQCLLEEGGIARSAAFRAMTRRILSGLRKAARVVFDTSAVREEVLQLGLIPPERTVVVPLGVHPAFNDVPDGEAGARMERILGPLVPGAADILHVGNVAPRKRIDLLLEIFAAVRAEIPDARLIRVGGAFAEEQSRHVARLDLERSIVSLPFLTREELAAVYRRSALALVPSEIEGFGLPVVEAMACGTPVVASNLPVLMEVGGDAASYRQVGAIEEWVEVIVTQLRERGRNGPDWERRRRAALAQAKKFTWDAYSRSMVEVYQELLVA